MAILPNFLEDAIDLHVHSAPDVDARRFNDLELITDKREYAPGDKVKLLINSSMVSPKTYFRSNSSLPEGPPAVACPSAAKVAR